MRQLARYIERARAATQQRPTFSSVQGCYTVEIRAADLTLDKFSMPRRSSRPRRRRPRVDKSGPCWLPAPMVIWGDFCVLSGSSAWHKVGGKVICIARGQDPVAARRRIAAAFDTGDESLKQRFESLAADHLEVLNADLSEPQLGLDPGDWQRLAERVDLIVHPAAFVNHVLPYQQLFGPNVVGTAELIRLALAHHRKRFVNVSTVAAAMLPEGGTIDEDADVRAATPARRFDIERYADGYAHSKWAGEVLLREAHDRFELPVAVFRSDMILAHSRYNGQINVPDMFTRWLLSIILTGLAPRSFYAPGAAAGALRWSAGRLYGGSYCNAWGATHRGLPYLPRGQPHDDGISMDSFIDWAIEAGYSIQRIDDYDDWIGRFETALRALPENQRQHSSLPLLHQLRRPMPPTAGAMASAVRFRADVHRHGIGGERDIPHLSAAFIRKYLDDLRVLGLISAA